jgi:hypothetical protein
LEMARKRVAQVLKMKMKMRRIRIRIRDTIVQLGARLARSSTFGSLSRRFGIAGRVAAR